MTERYYIPTNSGPLECDRGTWLQINKPQPRPRTEKAKVRKSPRPLLRAYIKACGRIKKNRFTFRFGGHMAESRSTHIVQLLNTLEFPYRISVVKGWKKEIEVRLWGGYFTLAWLRAQVGHTNSKKDAKLAYAAEKVKFIRRCLYERDQAFKPEHQLTGVIESCQPNTLPPNSTQPRLDREPFLNEPSQPSSEDIPRQGKRVVVLDALFRGSRNGKPKPKPINEQKGKKR